MEKPRFWKQVLWFIKQTKIYNNGATQCQWSTVRRSRLWQIEAGYFRWNEKGVNEIKGRTHWCYQAGTEQVEYCIERLVLSRCDSLTWYKTDYVCELLEENGNRHLEGGRNIIFWKASDASLWWYAIFPPGLQLFSDLYSRVEKSLKVTVMIVQKFLHLSDKITVLWSILMSK